MALTLNNNLFTLKVGDYIWCKYSASTSNSVGVFSDFAQKMDAEVSPSLIPLNTIIGTPNGYFKFICVKSNSQNETKLIADRNIQNSISWDTLNIAGVINGLPIFITDTDYRYTVRLMTGGTSSSDKDNEWDQIIVNSDLNGTITAGDNNIWHWKLSDTTAIRTWTSEVGNVASQRVQRSGQNPVVITNRTSIPSSQATSGDGFRPVLLIKTSPKYLIKQNNTIYTYDDINNTIIESPSQELNSTNFKENGFDPLIITEEQWNSTFPDKTNLQLLKWTGDTSITESTITCNIKSYSYKPIDQFGENKILSASFTTTDNKIFTVNPLTNVPFKYNSVICYKDGIEAIPDEINYDEGIVVFNTEQIGIMTFDYTYIVPFDILLYKPNN